ncbi:hypothetical protein B0H11DRAFT_1282950 [Mycena galericulata]|nr:hypothetical protein B0H11DRAFT_1282950 [Mycena galericulata]
MGRSQRPIMTALSRWSRLSLKWCSKLVCRKEAISIGPQQSSSPDMTKEFEQVPSQQTPDKARHADPAHTARNVFKFALQTLRTISNNIPLGQSLNSVIDPVLAAIARIEQTSDNAQGFVELAARIKLLTPIISEMGTPLGPSQIFVPNTPSDSPDGPNTSSRGQFVLEALRQ